MSNGSVTVSVDNAKKKSNAPWILGVIGFILSIPNAICTLFCGAVAAVAEAQNGEAAAGGFANFIAGNFWLIVLASIVSFIMLFFGKKSGKAPVVCGWIAIACAAYICLCSVVVFSLFGLAAAICFLIGGICSLKNSKISA